MTEPTKEPSKKPSTKPATSPIASFSQFQAKIAKTKSAVSRLPMASLTTSPTTSPLKSQEHFYWKCKSHVRAARRILSQFAIRFTMESTISKPTTSPMTSPSSFSMMAPFSGRATNHYSSYPTATHNPRISFSISDTTILIVPTRNPPTYPSTSPSTFW